MKRLLVVVALLGLIILAHLGGWFVPGPPQVLEYPRELTALQKSMYDSMDPVTQSKWNSMKEKPSFVQMRNCGRDTYGSTADGKTLYVCSDLTKLELALELAHLVDHASLIALGRTDHEILDRSAVLAECTALKHFAPIHFDKFPICRESSSDVLNGKYSLQINQVLGRNLKYVVAKADQEQQP